MDFDTQVKLAIYQHFAEMGRGPTPEEIAERMGSDADAIIFAKVFFPRRLRV